MPPADPGEEILAAGGVVHRLTDDRVEIAVIHRPRHDDWTLPKGKLDPGEDLPAAALREVKEETGHRCRLLRDLGSVRYRARGGRPKVVRYWLMSPVEGEFRPHHEVDELRWLHPDAAMDLLSHDLDRRVVRRALEAL